MIKNFFQQYLLQPCWFLVWLNQSPLVLWQNLAFYARFQALLQESVLTFLLSLRSFLLFAFLIFTAAWWIEHHKRIIDIVVKAPAVYAPINSLKLNMCCHLPCCPPFIRYSVHNLKTFRIIPDYQPIFGIKPHSFFYEYALRLSWPCSAFSHRAAFPSRHCLIISSSNSHSSRDSAHCFSCPSLGFVISRFSEWNLSYDKPFLCIFSTFLIFPLYNPPCKLLISIL